MSVSITGKMMEGLDVIAKAQYAGGTEGQSKYE
jgi:hypothetical protein